MASTNEPKGWTSQFREIVLGVESDLHSLEPQLERHLLAADDYVASQATAAALRADGSNAIHCPSVRQPGGWCVALFYPDGARDPVQGRHLSYHWDGRKVDLVRDHGSNGVFRVEE